MLECDLCINNVLACHNTELLKCYTMLDWRCVCVCVCVCVDGWEDREDLQASASLLPAARHTRDRAAAAGANVSGTEAYVCLLRGGTRGYSVRPLVYLVKQWAKRRKIHEPYRGYPSSYSYTLMVMHYLQVAPAVFACSFIHSSILLQGTRAYTGVCAHACSSASACTHASLVGPPLHAVPRCGRACMRGGTGEIGG